MENKTELTWAEQEPELQAWADLFERGLAPLSNEDAGRIARAMPAARKEIGRLRTENERLKGTRDYWATAAEEARHWRDHNSSEIEILNTEAKALTAQRNALLTAIQKIVNADTRCIHPEHRPLRFPLCRICQRNARIEEAAALLDKPEAALKPETQE